MTTQTEALKMALEALESCDEGDWSTGHVIHPSYDEDAVKQAMIAIKEVLAQPEQEPVAYTNGTEVILAKHWTADYPPEGWKPLDYTTPPQRKPLTDEQIMKMWIDAGWPVPLTAFTKVIRAIEAAHGIKE